MINRSVSQAAIRALNSNVMNYKTVQKDALSVIIEIWPRLDEGRTIILLKLQRDALSVIIDIWPRLDERRTIILLKPQRDVLSVIIGIIKRHCIMDTHARRIGLGHLASDFCRSCTGEEEEETVRHLLGTCADLCRERKTSTWVLITWIIWRNC